MIVTELRSNYVVVKHLNGSESFEIPRIPIVAKDKSIPFEIQGIRLPLRLAFSMTIIKAQMQTFDRLRVHLEHPPFEHGQLYVAISRVRSAEGLSIYNGESSAPVCSTRNIVYSELMT